MVEDLGSSIHEDRVEVLMTKDLYYETARAWKWPRALQAKGDDKPQMLCFGAGPSDRPFDNVRDALARHPGTSMARGYKMKVIHGDDGDWVVSAYSHVVIRHATGRYECVTATTHSSSTQTYVFVPSSRMHPMLTDDQLLSGRWILGYVLIGSDRVCNRMIAEAKVFGRLRSVVARTPEECVGRPMIVSYLPICFQEWATDRFGGTDQVSLGELMGMPTVDTNENKNRFSTQLELMRRMVDLHMEKDDFFFINGCDAMSTDAIEHTIRKAVRNKQIPISEECLVDAPKVLARTLLYDARVQTGTQTREEAREHASAFLDLCFVELNEARHRAMRLNFERGAAARAEAERAMGAPTAMLAPY